MRQDAVNNRVECLTQVEMEVFQQDIILFADCVAQVDVLEDVTRRLDPLLRTLTDEVG